MKRELNNINTVMDLILAVFINIIKHQLLFYLDDVGSNIRRLTVKP